MSTAAVLSAPASPADQAAALAPASAPRLALRLVALTGLLAVALVAGVRLGAVDLGVRDILDALVGRGDATTVTIVRELRLPRAVQAALVGAALALSGATFQALLRNPLADPYVLGVSSGAAVGAVLAVVSGVAARLAWGVPVAAFAGGIVAMLLVGRIALGVGGARALDTRVLLLAGVVVGSFCNAVIWLVLSFADVESMRAAIFWMMGSHAGASWRSTLILAAYLAPALVVLRLLARPLDLLGVGEDAAGYLGVRVERTKLAAYATATLVTAAAVSACGVVGFVGLVVPHVARMLWGSAHRGLLPSAALLGASFLVLADALARVVAAPVELPIGVVTAFVGVPFFVWLLRRRGSA